LVSAPPPSEPYERISRVRLSSRWCYPQGDGRMGTLAEGPVPCLRNRIRPCATTWIQPACGGVRSLGRWVPGGAPARGGRVSTGQSLTALSGSDVPGTSRRRLHLPAPLRSTGITRLPRYYGCSDSCTAALRTGFTAHEHPLAPCRSLCFTCLAFRAFRPQPPGAAPSLLSHTTPQRDGLPTHVGLGFAFSQQARRTARPKRVR
jgi:hypothetical protein